MNATQGTRTISRESILDMLPQLADATGIFLLRQTMRSIPKSLIEIAGLDGISRMRTLWDIILPICRPSIVATGIIFFINSWNEYVWPTLILRSKETFYYRGRNRRPPLDNVNAMLSFSYSLLAGSCASALESVGLDAYVGFLHRDRPGRTSLALDLMEELRPCMADRFVLTLINNQVMRAENFETAENGAVLMTDMGRRKFLKSWQERKQETITHPYLGEKLPWGLVPYMQALLLARYLRRDLDAYPPFLWK